MPSTKRKWFFALFLLFVLALAWVVWSRFQDTAQNTARDGGTRAIPVEVAPVEQGPIELRRTFSGALESPAEFVVAPKVSGRVVELSVDLGDRVARGQVVARLDNDEIEEIVGTVPGVEDITSTSSEGNSRIRVSFVWGTDIDTAALDVQTKLEDEINELPDDIVRPRTRKFDIASFPVVLLGVSSRLDPVELTQLIEDQIRYGFTRVPGVAQVDLWGGYEREVRIELDPERIKALGLPLNRVIQAVRNANLDLPAGMIEQGRYEVVLRAPAEYTSLDQIRNTVVLRRTGAAVSLGQIAEVRDTYQKLDRIVRVNQERGLRVAIRKQADANTVEASRRVLAEIEAVNTAPLWFWKTSSAAGTNSWTPRRPLRCKAPGKSPRPSSPVPSPPWSSCGGSPASCSRKWPM